jgi:hypothetical protein
MKRGGETTVIDKDLLQAYPTKRIKPIDGLSVTAEVWDEAHEYHRLRQRYHTLLAHGYGIVAGMEVVASDPADSQVYIMPGMAISPTGDEIALTQAISYDLGKAQDTLHILLSFGESAPAPDPGGNDGARLYIHSGFEVEARPTPPAGPHIELARIKRLKRDEPITNASDPAHPQVNQIDTRFRRMLVQAPPAVASIAVIYMGGRADGGAGKGADQMVRALNASSGQHACVDDGVGLAGIEAYTLVHLTAQAAFQMSPEEMNTLYAYLQGGGTAFIESARQKTAAGDPPSDAVFLDLLSSFGIKLEEVKAGHEILSTPHLFGSLPAGFEGVGKGKLMVGGGVVFSTADYASVWRGEQRSGPASREDIRAAHEWGANLVAYALSRHTTH